MSESGVNSNSEEEPILSLLQQIKDGRIDPKVIDKTAR